jgi:DNA-binding NarL/FixJ family response regulator
MRVVVADDVLLTRQGIVRLLRDAGVDVVAEAEDAEGLVRQVSLTRPDVAVVDIRMPPTLSNEGLVAAEEIAVRHPSMGVLLLSHYVEPSYALRLLRDGRGHVGYLLKDRVLDVDDFVAALVRVAAGETVVDPSLVEHLVDRAEAHDLLDDLTAREREVLALMAEGLTDRGISERLYVTPKTTETHIRHIFQKLGIPASPTHNRRVHAVLSYLRREETARDSAGGAASGSHLR